MWLILLNSKERTWNTFAESRGAVALATQII